MNSTNQQSKIALVTGGSRGIGKSIALNAAMARRKDFLYSIHPNPAGRTSGRH